MKKMIFLVLCAVLIMTACTQTPQPQVAKKGQDSVRVVEPNFFYVVKDTVKSGANTWDRAMHIYGDGYCWRDIVRNNSFLQEQGRTWQDTMTGIWYCLVLPGEVLEIGTVFPDLKFTDSLPIIPPPVSVVKSATASQDQSIFSWPWWAWLLLFIGFAFIGALIRAGINRERNIDPVNAGPPQVPGGVSDSGAYSRMLEIARNRFPGANLAIRNIRRGLLSGLADVSYADGKTRKINLKKVHAHAGEIMVNGQSQTIYFLQGCGNDARSGSFMQGKDLVFTPDVAINEDGSESPLPVPLVAEEKVKESSAPVVDLGSEFHQHADKVLVIIADTLKNEAKHKVVFKITHESLDVTIESWFDRPKKQQDQAPSTEKNK